MNSHFRDDAHPSLIARALHRDRELPVAHMASKAVRFGAAVALAPLFLVACDHVGPGARVRGRPIVTNAGRMTIGARAYIGSTFLPARFRTGPKGTLTIGDDLLFNFGASISASERVTLGNGVSVGPFCEISDEDGAFGTKPIVIGDGAWLAARVKVRPGAVIGEGAVIGAGSEVIGAIPPYVVAGGVPARVIRHQTKGGAPVDAPREARAGAIVEGPERARHLLRRVVSTVERAWVALALLDLDEVGARARIHGLPFIENLGKIRVGDDFELFSSPVRAHLVTGLHGFIEIGDRVILESGVGIATEGQVQIGSDVRLAPFVMILGSDFHAVEDRDAPGRTAPIVIGDGARLGEGVVVLRGARIGRGAYVEAGSVVVGEIPDGARASGVPARAPRAVSAPPPRAPDVVDAPRAEGTDGPAPRLVGSELPRSH
jgi:acetyltransferase-like isoleucine patch superfamily enzyme